MIFGVKPGICGLCRDVAAALRALYVLVARTTVLLGAFPLVIGYYTARASLVRGYHGAARRPIMKMWVLITSPFWLTLLLTVVVELLMLMR